LSKEKHHFLHTNKVRSRGEASARKAAPTLSNKDWLALIPAISRANRALAEYNGRLHRLPNLDLLLSPLRLQEAVLSSRIEGTLATMSEVLQFEAGQPPER
jgi:Fic family protein